MVGAISGAAAGLAVEYIVVAANGGSYDNTVIKVGCPGSLASHCWPMQVSPTLNMRGWLLQATVADCRR
jgi:hypothetical protein